MKSYKRYFSTIFFTSILFLAKLPSYGLNLIKDLDEVNDKGEKAANSRSDTLDILHYTIDLDMTDLAGRQLKGNCIIQLVALENNIRTLFFDLLKLTPDSILWNGAKQVFNYNDTLIKVSLSGSMDAGDTANVQVFYGGSPVRDSRWGGFYYQGNYAYNLGVGFDADPHNYGRVWFPCFDNFVERSSYTFIIKTADGKKAHCNGELINETNLGGDTLVRTWEMEETIPSYLACVAIADYETIRMTHSGVAGPVPIEVAAREPDTINVKNSFTHLPDAIEAYEVAFGPFSFNKVGFSIVPFNAGAMEHATNVAYPRYAVDGSLDDETLMAHELSHHWWGDLVTCETAGDMWLNEGMASYAEHLFLEHVYGRDRYLNAVQDNHERVLRYAHLREETHRALSGMPHEYTYGMHVYDKGASVIHNLRTYLKDTDFFDGLTDFLNTHAFSAINSTLLRDHLQVFSGTDLSDFFSDWIFNPGFPHYSIDSSSYSTNPDGTVTGSFYVRQKVRGTSGFFSNVPLKMTFWDKDHVASTVDFSFSGENALVEASFPEPPAMAAINVGNEINQAITADQIVIQDEGDYDLQRGKMNIAVSASPDSTLLRIEHHWVAPDPLPSNLTSAEISDYHYWSVDGIWADGFKASALLYYDGRNILSGGQGHLDVDLLSPGEDSILLMYRRGAHEQWTEVRGYSVDPLTSSIDRYGSITINELRKGEYALARGQTVVGIKPGDQKKTPFVSIFPNPARNLVQIDVNPAFAGERLKAEIYDLNGKMVDRFDLLNSKKVSTADFAPGTYIFNIMRKGAVVSTDRVVIQ